MFMHGSCDPVTSHFHVAPITRDCFLPESILSHKLTVNRNYLFFNICGGITVNSVTPCLIEIRKFNSTPAIHFENGLIFTAIRFSLNVLFICIYIYNCFAKHKEIKQNKKQAI